LEPIQMEELSIDPSSKNRCHWAHWPQSAQTLSWRHQVRVQLEQ